MDISKDVRAMIADVAAFFAEADGAHTVTRPHLLAATNHISAVLRQEFDQAMVHGTTEQPQEPQVEESLAPIAEPESQQEADQPPPQGASSADDGQAAQESTEGGAQPGDDGASSNEDEGRSK